MMNVLSISNKTLSNISYMSALDATDLGEDVSLGHDGEDEGVLAVGELARLVGVLPRVVFLQYIYLKVFITSILQTGIKLMKSS